MSVVSTIPETHEVVLNEEDRDHDEGILREEQPRARLHLRNSAFLFIKPHACNERVKEYIRDRLKSVPTMMLRRELDLGGSAIDEQGIIDRHYRSISTKAQIENPRVLTKQVKADRFFDKYKEPWGKAVEEDRVCSARMAMEQFHLTSHRLLDLWRQAEHDSQVCKLGGGFYCGLLQIPKGEETSSQLTPVYVLNGFYPALKQQFVNPDAHIYGLELEWDAEAMSWRDFRKKFIGVTNPANAEEGSIRQELWNHYKEFDMVQRPNASDNGVHASASPLEALWEKYNFMNVSIPKDPFGHALALRGLTERLLQEEFFKDAVVKIPSGASSRQKRSNVFDVVEDMNAEECLEMLVAIYDQELEDARREGGSDCQDCVCTVM